MPLQRWILLIIAALLVGLVETTFVTFLPSPWRAIRPILDVTVLLVVLDRPKQALAFAAIAGMIMDLFSSGGAGFASMRFLAATLLLLLLSQTVLTNRSVYATAILILGARLFDRTWLTAVAFFERLFGGSATRLEPWSATAVSLAWDIGLVSVGFILLALFTRRFLMPVARESRAYDR